MSEGCDIVSFVVLENRCVNHRATRRMMLSHHPKNARRVSPSCRQRVRHDSQNTSSLLVMPRRICAWPACIVRITPLDAPRGACHIGLFQLRTQAGDDG